MAYDTDLVNKVRNKLKDAGIIDEKRMFRSLGFMVNGKMAVCVGKDDVMFKVGPDLTQAKLAAGEAEPVSMNSRTMKSWVFVKIERLQDAGTFDEWISAALNFNVPQS